MVLLGINLNCAGRGNGNYAFWVFSCSIFCKNSRKFDIFTSSFALASCSGRSTTLLYLFSAGSKRTAISFSSIFRESFIGNRTNQFFDELQMTDNHNFEETGEITLIGPTALLKITIR